MRDTYRVMPHHYTGVLELQATAWGQGKAWGVGAPAGIGDMTYHRATVDELTRADGLAFHAHCGYRDMRGA